MCGINGITTNDESILERMTRATAHRGPDATGFFYSPRISFGHNRLSVIDLSPAANQPMHSDDGRYSIVFNGEIYNYRELKEEIGSKWNFKTQGDSEVLLAGYALWGMDVVHRVKGIFVFAVWDHKEEILVLARDHMGVKPLYFAVKDGTLFFSSELGGIIAGTGYRSLCRETLSHYVTLNYVPSPMTLVEGIHKLSPSHTVRYQKGAWEQTRYFTPEKPATSHYRAEDLRSVIGQSVKRQLVSDRKLGVFLSGGLDSSIVLHHASSHIQDLETFSVDFEMAAGAPQSELTKFNTDAKLAAKTAEHYGAKHTTFTLRLEDVQNSLHNALLCLDEPIANPTSVSQYLLSKWVREKGVVVALGGDGGDELFGGYTRHRYALASWYFKKLPKLIQSSISYTYPSAKKLGVPFGADFFHMQVLGLKPDKYKSIFQSAVESLGVHNFFAGRYNDEAIRRLHPLDAFMRVDRESWLCDESLARTDRTSMAFGVEARVPLLDTEVVAYADTIVGHTKFTPWSNKKILRDAYQGHLPAYLFSEPKRGWLSPGSKWLRDPIIKKYVTDTLSPQHYDGLSSVVSWGGVDAMLQSHVEQGGYHLYPLWNILQLQVWAEKYKITS